mmetsp:Transcript_25878/g.36060  ORF Transcript_25878/g.36060 Transcript_25878/m.36060 type:complete len:202 (-) Transcript_25878:861-1466(-)
MPIARLNRAAPSAFSSVALLSVLVADAPCSSLSPTSLLSTSSVLLGASPATMSLAGVVVGGRSALEMDEDLRLLLLEKSCLKFGHSRVMSAHRLSTKEEGRNVREHGCRASRTWSVMSNWWNHFSFASTTKSLGDAKSWRRPMQRLSSTMAWKSGEGVRPLSVFVVVWTRNRSSMKTRSAWTCAIVRRLEWPKVRIRFVSR